MATQQTDCVHAWSVIYDHAHIEVLECAKCGKEETISGHVWSVVYGNAHIEVLECTKCGHEETFYVD